MAEQRTESIKLALTIQRPGKPKRSASLILIDRTGAVPRILLGRRSDTQKFMPNLYVFPGGKTDRQDHKMHAISELRDFDNYRLLRGLGANASAAKARSIALTAIRETYEETGLVLGAVSQIAQKVAGWSDFAKHGLAPQLACLRVIARAVTPPNYPHRYDTHFFAAFRDAALHEGASRLRPSDEIADPGWFTISEAKQLALPSITLQILLELETRLGKDPALEADLPMPYFSMRRGKFIRETY